MPSSGERVAVSESMNRDLNRVSVWCNLWGMKLNASKTKTQRDDRHLTKVSAQIIQCIIFERNKLSITLSTLW